MITHCLKLENKVTGILNSHQKSNSGDLENSVQTRFPITPAHESNSFIDEKNKIITLLQSQIDVLENELQKAREESYLAGYKEGRNAGQDEVKMQHADIGEEFAALTRSMRDQYDRSLENMNGPLLELSVKTAEKIIGKELQFTQSNDQVLIGQIKKMLNKVVNQNSISIRVNPNFLDCVNKDQILDELNISPKTGVSCISDDKLIAGECILETEDFILDGLLSRQLSNVKDKILGSNAEWID